MVRDEAAVLDRCLEAASPVVDALCLCDTGSRDDTVERAESWMARRAVPGSVHRHEWRDFGVNRTLALEAARGLVAELGWDPQQSYLLLLDGDMVLEVSESFHRSLLQEDVYRVLQRNGVMVYPNVRLVRASVGGRFVCPTHEYFELPDGASIDLVSELSIRDLYDGGSRADKLERVERLLEQELRENPGSARAMFYLAQTYRGLRDYGRALFWYQRRIAAGGWAEEIWFSRYTIGMMQLEVGDARNGVRSMHASLRMDPGRAEPWFQLAFFFRKRGRFGLATFYAQRGLEAKPETRLLFVEPGVHPEGLRRELQIAAYSTRWRELGFDAGERLVLGEGVHPDLTDLAAGNQVFYAGALPTIRHVRVEAAVPDPFVAATPSVIPTSSGYLVCCKAVTYRIDAHQRFVSAAQGGVQRTESYLFEIDRDLTSGSQAWVEHDLVSVRDTQVQGLEDSRLVEWRGRRFLLGTSWNLHPQAIVRMSLAVLDGARIERLVPLSGYGDDRSQKNWLPFVDPHTGELHALYGYAPLVVLRVDVETGVCKPVVQVEHRRNLGRWRGSAGPLALPPQLGGGWLVLIHDVSWHGRRYYLHRFVHYSEDWELRRVSRPFFFRQREIEFSCGMCFAHEPGRLIVGFSVMDREAWLAEVELGVVDELLKPV